QRRGDMSAVAGAMTPETADKGEREPRGQEPRAHRHPTHAGRTRQSRQPSAMSALQAPRDPQLNCDHPLTSGSAPSIGGIDAMWTIELAVLLSACVPGR